MRALTFAILACLPLRLLCAELNGHLELYLDGKALRPEETQDAIVYFRPKNPATLVPEKAPYLMTTRRKQFAPRVLAITVGSSVRFPNEDPILHNAFSSSKDNAFDVGLYGQGEGQVISFTHTGYVKVYCNVHHSMVGHILVLDTPYFDKPNAKGDFHLTDLPSVPGDLVIWHDRAAPWHTSINPADAAPLQVRLDVNQRRVAPHMNKFGKPYERGSDAGY